MHTTSPSIHSEVNKWVHFEIRAHIHTHTIHTCIHTYIRTYVHTYMHIASRSTCVAVVAVWGRGGEGRLGLGKALGNA